MGAVNITQGTGTPIRTVNNAGVDGGAQQQVVTLADAGGDFLHASVIPAGTEDALMVRTMPSQVTRYGFNKVFASTPDPDNWSVVKAGSGQTVSQSGGALVLTSGTTANAETIIRGLTTFSGALRMRIRSFLSQRIANQQFIAELVDIIGDGLATTINSATSVTVTLPAATASLFSAASVGQSMYLGGYTGTGTFIPGRYTIASVSGNQVTFTVAGFAAGSGTCSAFGWSYNHLIYDGTVNTNAKWDTQRKGWNGGDTTITTYATTSPGHLAALYQNDLQASILDAQMGSTGGIQFAPRGSRVENVPDDMPLALQIRIVNGATAPASTTTWTIGQVSVGNWAPQDVAIQDVRPVHPMSALPVQVNNTPTVTVGSGTLNIRADGATSLAFAAESTAAVYTAVVKAANGMLSELSVFNAGTSAIYVKLYNKTAAPTLASDTPVATYVVDAGRDRVIEFGTNGKRFTSGIAIAVTGGAAKTDTTALVAGCQISGSYV